MFLKSLPAWFDLQNHHAEIHGHQMRDWFAAEDRAVPSRAERYTVSGAGVTLDFSKNRIDDTTLALLQQLAKETGVAARRDAMLAGSVVNPTERRAALHTLLRAAPAAIGPAHPLAGQFAQVLHERERTARFADAVRSGTWTGYTGKPIRDVINIGIGGSDLGPKMVAHALAHYADAGIGLHYVSNVDGTDLQRVLDRVDPETTLAIVVSKTFTTQETMTNAQSLRHWLVAQGCPQDGLARHFAAVSANPEEAQRFGVAPERVFEMWDWIGGRYSLWSSVGLSVMIGIGSARFAQLLDGAHEMDQHFATAPPERNLPLVLGLLGIWYRNFFGAQSHLVAPYAEALHYLPSYLQQLDMESNGKSMRVDGMPADYDTAPVIWGEPGTNGQHAFFQMLHQGSTLVPIDFIAVLRPEHGLPGHHARLLANCFAQSEALMLGRSLEAARKVAGPDRPDLAPHLVFSGNRPSNTLLIDALTPATLGALIALYEHKILVQAAVWHINPFDQWGVELGKILGKVVEADLLADGEAALSPHDSSTRALIARARAAT